MLSLAHPIRGGRSIGFLCSSMPAPAPAEGIPASLRTPGTALVSRRGSRSLPATTRVRARPLTRHMTDKHV
jgi:hypothetical protein